MQKIGEVRYLPLTVQSLPFKNIRALCKKPRISSGRRDGMWRRGAEFRNDLVTKEHVQYKMFIASIQFFQ